jgi:hypothetical protein
MWHASARPTPVKSVAYLAWTIARRRFSTFELLADDGSIRPPCRRRGLPEPAISTIDVSNASRERRIYGVEFLVSHTLDECLHPRALRLGVGQLPVEIRMCVAVDAVFGRSVRVPFVGIVEPLRR